ncbi:vamp, partial [Trichoplax adhaerens]
KELQKSQAQVKQVMDIMQKNVDKAIEREEKISVLNERADSLYSHASEFETNAAQLKNKYWWKNFKMWIILIVTIILIVVAIVVWIVLSHVKKSKP